jgi:hypothetical protein
MACAQQRGHFAENGARLGGRRDLDIVLVNLHFPIDQEEEHPRCTAFRDDYLACVEVALRLPCEYFKVRGHAHRTISHSWPYLKPPASACEICFSHRSRHRTQIDAETGPLTYGRKSEQVRGKTTTRTERVGELYNHGRIHFQSQAPLHKATYETPESLELRLARKQRQDSLQNTPIISRAGRYPINR